MKERPIIFSGPMVRAILDGKKTQTRRICKPQPKGDPVPLIEWSKRLAAACHDNNPDGTRLIEHSERLAGRLFPFGNEAGNLIGYRCPHGQPGKLLWVKETYLTDNVYDHLKPSEIPKTAPIEYTATDLPFHLGKTRPSIFMCRWMSRITLEITNVRVERVQDISEEDAKKEGAAWNDFGKNQWNQQRNGWSMERPFPGHHDECLGSARFAFANYINKIHGGKNWNLKETNLWRENPWVWVVEFKKVD
jgi:hypothetical protein